MRPDELKMGTLEMSAPMAHHTLQCCQFAYDFREDIFLVGSVAGPQTAVKSFAAALNENVKLKIVCRDFQVVAFDDTVENVPRYTDFKKLDGQGKYRTPMHRLGFNQVHCLAIAKDERLMPCVTEEALWQKLRSSRFTTPLLRSWMPWLMRQLVDDGHLVKLPAFNCRPGLLKLEDAGLDTLVSRGVGTGALKIGKESAVCSS